MPTYRRKTDARDKLTPAEKRRRKKELEEQRLDKEKKDRDYKRFLRKMGYHKRTKAEMAEAEKIRQIQFENEYETATHGSLQTILIPGVAPKKDILNDYKWKKDAKEKASTIKGIKDKAGRVAPAFNKGSTQYITDGTDTKTLGRKV